MSESLGTRQRLLEATIATISQHGEAAVKVDAIAEAANITKPSLYHFFGDRDGLIIAAQAERFRRSVRFGLSDFLDQAQACSSQEEYVELIRRAMLVFGTPEGCERRRVRLEVFGSAVSRPALQSVVNQVLLETANDLSVLFDIGRSRGWVTLPVPSQSIAVWWHGTLLGRYLAESNDALSTDDWDTIMVTAALHLLFGDH